jgi:hypothetical protein
MSMTSASRKLLLAWFALAFLDGAVGFRLFPFSRIPPTTFVASLAAGFIAFLWYRFDSDSRSLRRSLLLSIVIVGCPFLGIPYYLFNTRGFRRGAVACAVYALLLVGYGVVHYLGMREAWKL